MTTSSLRFRYLPPLDGLRGIAVLAVMIFHTGLSILPGGFLGVDIFFVLSGYLITALLAREFDDSGAIRFRNFYMRRVLRLAPALLLMLFCFLLLAALDRRISFAQAARESAFALFYTMNWAWVFNWGTIKFIGHTWSLSIEEQYYLLWPVLCLVLFRASLTRHRLALLVFGAVALLWLYRVILILSGASFTRIYDGLDTHAEGLLMGAAAALLFSSAQTPVSQQAWSERRASLLSFGVAAAATFIMIMLVSSLSAEVAETYFYIIPLVEISVIILLAGAVFLPRHPVYRLMTFPVFLWLGRISYGLYLWHQLIYRILLLDGATSLQLLIFGSTMSVLVAALSFYLLERPILRLKTHFPPQPSSTLEASLSSPPSH